MEFNFDDDDLFENENSKNNKENSVSWKPKSCDRLWFLSVAEGPSDEQANSQQAQQFLCENPLIETKRFQANYHFFAANYEAAVDSFTELIQMLPQTNLVARREASEGLARSLMKIGKLEEAQSTANELEFYCKSKAHFVNYHLVCASIHHQRGNFTEEAKNLQKAINFYQLNPDLWLKLGLCYSGISRVDLFQFEESSSASLKAAACLVRARLILKCVAGTVQSFSKTRNRKLLEDLDSAMEIIPNTFISKAQMAMCRDVYNCDLREKKEFQDLGSSRAKACEEVENAEDESRESESRFDSQWFAWIGDIKH